MANYGHKVFRKVNKTKKRRQQQKDLKDAVDEFLKAVNSSQNFRIGWKNGN